METPIEVIWLDLHQELKNFINSKVQDSEISNDILQDVFLKIHLQVHQLKDQSKLTAWVYQITRNTITDYFRKLKPHQNLDQMPELPEQEAQDPLYARLSSCINSKIEKLPAAYQEAVLLTTFQNYSQLQLAEYFGISYSGTKSRVQRAKEKLKDLVLDCTNLEKDKAGTIVGFNAPDETL